MELEEIKVLLAMGSLGFSVLIIIFLIIKLIAKLLLNKDTIGHDFLVFTIIAWIVISALKKIPGNLCLAATIGAIIGYLCTNALRTNTLRK